MNEVYAIFTTGYDYYDQPELFGLYANVEKAEAEAAVLKQKMCEFNPEERLYSLVNVTYVPIRY